MRFKRRIIYASGAIDTPKASEDQRDAIVEARIQEYLKNKTVAPLATAGAATLAKDSAFLRNVEAIAATDPPVDKGVSIENRIASHEEALRSKISSALFTSDLRLRVAIAPFMEREVVFVPGRIWGSETQVGPEKADVMIINRSVSPVDQRRGFAMCGSDAEVLKGMFEQNHGFDWSSAYVTSFLKFCPPTKKSTIKADWKKDCLVLLTHEIILVRPKFILTLGAEPSRVLLKVTDSEAAQAGIHDYRYGLARRGDPSVDRISKLIPLPHPGQIVHDASAERRIQVSISRAVGVITNRISSSVTPVRHVVISSHDQLLNQFLEIEHDPEKEDDVIAVDAEWEGKHPVNAGSHIRTIQFAWKPGCAAGFAIHDSDGLVTDGFADASASELRQETIDLFLAFFRGGTYTAEDGSQHTFRKKRVVGHFFNADLEWLVAFGFDISECFECPLDGLTLAGNVPESLREAYEADGYAAGQIVPAWARTRHEGGADTGLMAHAVEESTEYGLEILAERYTSVHRYDSKLNEWKKKFCADNGLKDKDLSGYGKCPDDVLLPYGIYDADVTLRLFYSLFPLLDSDYDGNSCREAFWESQIAAPAVLEIHQTGLEFDWTRFERLRLQFEAARANLLQQLRDVLNWPTFNPRSTQQLKEALFGMQHNGAVDRKTGEKVRLRPADAFSLKLEPVFDTSKPPRPWGEITDAREAGATPSTDQKVLSVLFYDQDNPRVKDVLNKIRHFKFMNQALTTVLKPPKTDHETQQVVVDSDGEEIYENGLASFVCSDGRIRTHIRQVLETGRWASVRPNLQNLSKKRDSSFQEILGDEYMYPIRSIMKAIPGHVLVEADYIGAELYAMALLSGDPTMIDHATRNQLPETHPNYYDIHSNVSVLAFKLACPPTKSGLKSIGKSDLRNVAKSVIFGCAYGRGAKAIALAAQQEGISLSIDEAQAVIDAIYTLYPGLRRLFEECRQRAAGEYLVAKGKFARPVITNAFGRLRRFPRLVSDGSYEADQQKQRLRGEYGRQGMNFPIQSLVASVVSRAAARFVAFKRLPNVSPDLFKITLQIHDALYFQVPFANVKYFCESVLPYCMRKCVPIWPTDLAGRTIRGKGPFYLGIEAEMMLHWGEKLSVSEAEKRGLPTGVFADEGCVVKYTESA